MRHHDQKHSIRRRRVRFALLVAGAVGALTLAACTPIKPTLPTPTPPTPTLPTPTPPAPTLPTPTPPAPPATPPTPTVTSVSPTAGGVAGATPVIITGTGFSGTTAVTFGGTPATSFTVDNSTQISATAPAGTGTVNVSVTTPDGTNADTANDDYTYVPAAVTGLSPNQGPAVGGNSVTITGIGFTGATQVVFGSSGATNVVVVNDTTVTATAPGGTGVLAVRVITPSGDTAFNPPASNYTYIPAAVTGLSPNQGPAAGGNSVTITGTGFTGSTQVIFGSSSATNVVVVNDTTITATAPAGTGVLAVRVITPSGDTAFNPPATNYTYV